jgi:FlaG/FlaF family flagellin (archaellin)
MPAAGVVLIVAVVLIVLALVYYLVATIVALRQIADGLDDTISAVGEIVEKSAPVNGVVTTINTHLDAAVEALEGLLVKKAGLQDAIGLVDGLYPGAGEEGFRELGTTKSPRIGEVYTRGTLTLARLGREAPIAVASPAGGPVLRNVLGGSLAARALYPAQRPGRSPVIGQNEERDADPSAV